MLYSSSLSYSSIRFIMQSFTVWVIGKLRFLTSSIWAQKCPTACQNTLPLPAIRQNIQHHARIRFQSLQYVKISNIMPEYASTPCNTSKCPTSSQKKLILPTIRQNIDLFKKYIPSTCARVDMTCVLIMPVSTTMFYSHVLVILMNGAEKKNTNSYFVQYFFPYPNILTKQI